MNAATIDGTTFKLTQGVTPVAGAVTYAGTTATFVPAIVLIASAQYTATVTTGAKDVAGLALGHQRKISIAWRVRFSLCHICSNNGCNVSHVTPPGR